MVNQAVVAKTATEALRVLWKEEFFVEWRQKGLIVSALSEKGNHFSDPELGMALMRSEHLTRRGKRGKYEYIQKFPFNGQDLEKDRKRKGVKE